MYSQAQLIRPRLILSLVLSLTLLWIACSQKPSSVQALFPEIEFDESSQAKQFAVKATGSNPMIDDLEDGDLNGINADGRNWSWAQFDDRTDGIQYLTIQQEAAGPRQGSKVLYVKGGGWQKTGAGVSANLVYKTSPRMYGYYDASLYTGIEFWIKGTDLTQLTVSIGSPETTSTNDGGNCLSSPPGHFEHVVAVSGNWSQIRIPFSQFLLKNGKLTLPADPKKIKGIHFRFNTTADYEVWIDELSFFQDPEKSR